MKPFFSFYCHVHFSRCQQYTIKWSSHIQFNAHCERPVFHPTLPTRIAQRCCLSQHEVTTVCVPRSTVKGCHVRQREVSSLCLIQHFLRALYKDVQVSQREVSTVCVSPNTSYVHCVWRSEWVNIKWAQPVSQPTIPTCTVQGCQVSQCEVSDLCPSQQFLRALYKDVWGSQREESTVWVPMSTVQECGVSQCVPVVSLHFKSAAKCLRSLSRHLLQCHPSLVQLLQHYHHCNHLVHHSNTVILTSVQH